MQFKEVVQLDYSEVIESVKNSIAVVFDLDKNGLRRGHGTGFVFGQSNILVTCNHVLSDEGEARIKFVGDDNPIPATIVIRDVEHDLLLLKFDNDSEKTPLKKCPDKDIKLGKGTIMPGFPLESAIFTVHQGIIAGIGSDATGITAYTIDGTVNPGNSGGPLIDYKGRVCGVVNAKRRENNAQLEKIEKLPLGPLSIFGVDLVESLKAIVSNAQLGIGYAVPASYIPKHKSTKPKEQKNA